jgi:PBSX family phage terminase large subunit
VIFFSKNKIKEQHKKWNDNFSNQYNIPVPIFTPSCQQVRDWWDSPASVKLLVGANQSGKSTTGGAYVANVARKKPGGLSWACALTFDMCRILYEKITEYLAPHEIKTIVWGSRAKKIPYSLIHINGHEIVFKSMDSGFQKFEGAQVDGVIWIDEQCKQRQIVTSCIARTTMTGAPIILTFTPLLGKNFIYHDFFKNQDKNIFSTTITLYDNIFLNDASRDRTINLYSEEERPYRVLGQWAQLSGRIYKSFNREKHSIPFSQELLDSCHTIIRGVDFGTWKAVTWTGIDHNDNLYILREWKYTDYTIHEMSEAIFSIEKDMVRVSDDTVTDHSFQERYELERDGIYCTLADKSVQKGIEIIRRRLQNGSFFVCDTCPKTADEIEEYVCKEGSMEPKKGQDDHLCDTFRYGAVYAESYCYNKFGEIPRIESVAKSIL